MTSTHTKPIDKVLLVGHLSAEDILRAVKHFADAWMFEHDPSGIVRDVRALIASSQAAPQPAPPTGDEREALSDEQIAAIFLKYRERGMTHTGGIDVQRKLVRDVEQASAAHRREDQRDAALDQVMTERDAYHDMADKLAAAIAEYFGIEIGEHSNLNSPWSNALEHIEQAGGTPPEILSAKLIDTWCAANGKQIPWAKAVEISAIVTKMSDAERSRLLAMDERTAAPARGENGALEQGDAR